ncbi:uncharacterized protein LOC144747737 [Ciona intestinalis]
MALRCLRRCPFVRFTSKPRHDDVVHDDVIHDDVIHDDVIHDDVIHTINDVAGPEDCDVIKEDNIPQQSSLRGDRGLVMTSESNMTPSSTSEFQHSATTESYDGDGSSSGDSPDEWGSFDLVSTQSHDDVMRYSSHNLRPTKSDYDVIERLPPITMTKERSKSAIYHTHDVITPEDSNESSMTSSSVKPTSSSLTSLESDVSDDVIGYLKRAEPEMTLSNILSCDVIAASPFREFLSRGVKDLYADVYDVTMFDLWREIESLRVTYFRLKASEISTKLCDIIRQSEITMASVTSLKLLPNEEFPENLEVLQQKFENVIEKKWKLFAATEQEQLKRILVTEGWRKLKRRHSYPECRVECDVDPMLRFRGGVVGTSFIVW